MLQRLLDSIQHYRNVKHRAKRRASIKEVTGLSDEKLDELEDNLEDTFGSPLGKMLEDQISKGNVKVGM